MSALKADQHFRVDGLVAVITGGGTGIGLMMAKALAANGAKKIYIVGRRLEKLQAAAKDAEHSNIVPLQGDVTSKESLAAMAEQVQREEGYISLLVCNSGTVGPLVEGFSETASVAEIKKYVWAWDMKQLNSTFELNVTAAFFTVLAFLELLDAGNKTGCLDGTKSSVLITASIAGFMRSLSTGLAYTTSKAAAVHLVKVLATYFGRHQIRFNGLCPGIFSSEMTQGHVGASAGFSVSAIPLAKRGSEEDMAGTILWIASRAGADLDGNLVVLDGGRLSAFPATY